MSEEVITKKNKGKKEKMLSREVLNIIRTTMRNNIELTHIADNKANVLLSLNALMLTFLVPLIIPHMATIKAYHLYVPIVILVSTCFITIYVSALVLKPGKFFENRVDLEDGSKSSPFFFGNFYKMSQEQYRKYLHLEIDNAEQLKNHLTDDLHYIGVRLGRKMELTRIAFNVFKIGLFSAILVALGLSLFTTPG